jgi:zinc transport system substrate-binding protein
VSAVATLTLFVAAACGGEGDSVAANPDSAAGDTVSVVASFYPMAWLSERVGGDRVAVTTLTKPGMEPHDLELTPKQMAGIAEADYVLYVRELQPAVDDAVQQQAKDKSLDAASVVTTLKPSIEDTHEGEAAPADEEDHEQEGTFDPHLWVDPNRMAAIATALGERLAAADPSGAATFRANAREVAGQLTALDGEFRNGLKTCQRRAIVTAHASFGYLADRYGLQQIPIAGIDPANEPSPQRLAELTEQIKEHGATTVFTEALVSPRVAETLAREAGVKTATLDPLEGFAEGETGDYLSAMRQNLRTLQTALDCR